VFGRPEEEDEVRAPDDRASHSILGLESVVFDFPAAPPARPDSPRGASDLHRGLEGRSFLHLEDLPLGPFAAPAPPTSSGGTTASNGGPPTHSFLDLASDAGRPLALSSPLRQIAESSDAAPHAGRSVLGLPSRVAARAFPPPLVSQKAFAHAPVGAGLARSADAEGRPPRPDPVAGLFVELDRRSDRAFPVERGILISLALHFLIVLLLGRVRSGPGEANAGLLAALRPPPKSGEQEVPIIFHEAPGPERANPRRSDLSDRNRIAGGGDRSRPKSDTPFIPELPGKEGLTPGAPRTAQAQPPRGTQGGRGTRPDAGSARAPAAERPAPEVLGEERPVLSDAKPPVNGGTGAPGTSPGSPAAGLPNLSTVIQREAQNSLARGVGENGAGIPNPDGGFIDSGPVSFETSWYDWGAYAEEMVRRIKLHWDIPKLAELGWKGKLTIHFNIRLDGSVEGATLISGSGVPPFDFAAMQAILKSNPFRPLPKDLIKLVPGKTKEGITVTFFYNIRPDREGREGREGRSEGPR
jgi:TonB family protein